MSTVKSKKAFLEPQCEIVRFTTEDILATSSDDWNIGDQFVIDTIEEQ